MISICFRCLLMSWSAVVVFAALAREVSAQLEMGTAFTYQGSLKEGGSPASGAFDFEFTLWDDDDTGTQQGPMLVVNDLAVVNGLFTTPLDFGDVFNGSKRWLRIEVRPGASTDPHTPLMPRVELTPAPYAIFAKNAETVGGMTAGELQDDRPPLVVLEADRLAMLIGSPINGTVNFNLSHSYDAEGSALTYGFDPTGTQFGEPAYGGAATLAYSYINPGIYLAEGWARDPAGQYAVEKITISVEAGGGAVTADPSAGNVGSYTSLAVVSGNPAIAYHDETNADLKFVRAVDANGTGWGAPQTLDAAGSVGNYTSLAVVNGNPAISYHDISNVTLKYIRATNASGTAWGPPQTIDTTGFTGAHTSLAVVNGNPAISYQDNANGDLKYIRATDANGVAWGSPQAVASTNFVGLFTSLAVVNGNPAISYYSSTDADLKYVRASDADGTVWGTSPLTIDSSGSVGWYTSLVVVNGNPAISYYHFTNSDLKYVRATNASGTAWGAPQTIHSIGIAGQFTSMMVVNGIPAISYEADDNLYYIRATDPNGTTWAAPQAIDASGDVGGYTSLEMVNGFPAISYKDVTNGNLKFMR